MISMMPATDSPGGHPYRIRLAYDPEFDPAPARRPFLFSADPYTYQRLVVNPLLSLLALIGWVALMRFGYRERFLTAFLLAQVLPVLAFFAVQYHCLDCGATGPLSRWKVHACESVVTRQHAGRPRRFRGPNPRSQLLLWIYGLIATAYYAIVLR